MKQGKRKGSKRIKKEDMLASVVEFFNQDRKRAFNYKQVAHGLELLLHLKNRWYSSCSKAWRSRIF